MTDKVDGPSTDLFKQPLDWMQERSTDDRVKLEQIEFETGQGPALHRAAYEPMLDLAIDLSAMGAVVCQMLNNPEHPESGRRFSDEVRDRAASSRREEMLERFPWMREMGR